MTLRLRPYQADMVDAAHKAHDGGMLRPAEVCATGGGKSFVIANVIQTSKHGPRAGKRAVIIAHREELAEQNAQEVRDLAPDLRTGIVMGTRNETQGHVISAGVLTLASESRIRQIRDVGLVVVDECHHAAADSYVRVLQHFGCFAPGGAVALGMTATMKRGDDRALGDVWQDVVYVKDTAELIAEGFLVRPVAYRVRVEDLDLSKVRKVAGDFSGAGLGKAFADSMAPKKIAEALREHAPDRQTILFAPLVATAEVIRDELRAQGFTAELIHGKTPKDERKRLLQAYREGRFQVLCNAMVFTEGTNLPMTSCIVVARPTMNAALFIQMVGRGLRLWPGKRDCVVLDVVGATGRHRLAAPVELWGDEGVSLEEATEQLGPDGDAEQLDDAEEQAEVDHLLGLDEPVYRDGKLVTEVVDLFEGSDAGWLRTYAGAWFLAAPERYVAVLPRVDGGYGVVSVHRMRRGDSRWVMERCSELSYAMAHAEGDVSDDERDAMQYRHSEGRPRFVAGGGFRSSSPRAEAQRIGLPVPEGATPGEVRKMLTVAYASARIDAALPGWVRR